MKSPSNDLFKLIHSLTKSEKRYFKLFTRIHVKGEENNYIKLFDAIEAQTVYNEEKIKKKFKGEHFISYLPVEKVQLYNLIIRSLIVYGNKGDVETELGDDLSAIKILFRKGFYEQANKIAEKAKSIAIKNELYTHAINFEKWQMKIVYQSGLEINQQVISTKFQAQYDLLANEKNTSRYLEIQANLFSFLRKHNDVRSNSDLIEIKKIINTPLQSSEKEALTFTSKVLFHSNWAHYYQFICDYKKQHEQNKILVELFRQRKDSIYNFFSALVNYFNSCVLVKDFVSCEGVIGEIEALEVSPVFSQERKATTLFLLKLTLYIHKCMFNEALVLIKLNEKKFLYSIKKISPNVAIIIVYKIIYTYLILEKNADALRWYNNYFTKLNKDEIRKDVESMAKILYLVLHFELQNFDIMEYLMKSIYRWFLKQERLHKFEKAILDFIRTKAHRADNKRKTIEVFTQLKDQLLKIREDKFERPAFDSFDIIAWLESKITGKTFQRVLLESMGN